ncbi:MAG TPA: glycosyltransferase family 2 protein [Acidimicrobiales bacterium]|jgi:dolichol-phosphate mannosyltransferase|nr:glycosyltransferase family 2 protein [Acidimicrobiales bacterium]
MSKKLISVVTPAYNEEDCVDELARRLRTVFDHHADYDFEVIVVENGSRDDTFAKLMAIHDGDPRFKVVQLARNFRTDGGITAGLAHAAGDAAVVMSADLQDPPELIDEFIALWEEGYENIYGIVTARRGTGALRRMNSRLFYWLADKLTDHRIPVNASDFRLIDRKVYETVNSMPERNRFVRGLFAWTGYRSIGVAHERPPRFGGQSKADSGTIFDLAVTGILAHSYVPLRLITIFGLVLSALSMLALVGLTIDFVLFGVPFPGFGTIVAVNILLFGFLFCMLGIMSQYVGLIYEEVKQRPNFVVREKFGW